MDLNEKEIILMREVFAIASNSLVNDLQKSQYLTAETKVELVDKFAELNTLTLKFYGEYVK